MSVALALMEASASHALAGESPTGADVRARGPGERHVLTIHHGGFQRRYVAQVPGCYDGTTALPVVVALHGSGGTAEAFLDETNWGAYADQFRFIALAPEGLPLRESLPPASYTNPRVWNTGQYGSLYSHSRVDDVGFVIAVLDQAHARWKVDSRKVFAAGYSGDGAMVFRLAAERADRFTAIASVSGICWVADPRPSRSLPTLAVLGTLDPVVPLGGGLKILPWEVQPSPPVRAVMAKWAAAIGCPQTGRAVGGVPGHRVEVEDYGPGPAGNVLRVMYVDDQGHAWPGGHSAGPERFLGPNKSSFDATRAIWAFFQQWSW